MVTIHNRRIELGVKNMKKKKIEPYTNEISEERERQYQQKLKVNQRLYQTFLNSFSQCLGFPIDPNEDTAFLHKDVVINLLKDIKNKKSSNNKKSS